MTLRLRISRIRQLNNVDLRNLNPDLENFAIEGGLFDVEPCELDLNVGRCGKVADPNKPGFGRIHHERFQIVGLQKDYRGDVVYRVVCESDKNRFGSPLSPDEVLFEEDRKDVD
ncbi:hypothetical protein SH501x_001351 [Pirellulaceae bacterium SH501]